MKPLLFIVLFFDLTMMILQGLDGNLGMLPSNCSTFNRCFVKMSFRESYNKAQNMSATTADYYCTKI